MKEWLKNSVLYQIYPTSFYDSDGDGIGDLRGIAEKLDYIKDLGIDIIWINPIFKSEFRDGGYDVIDYREIDPRFGNMADFDMLIAKAESLGLRVCLDLVIGHTSWGSEWFKRSAERDRNEYSDYFIWTDNIFNKAENSISGLYDRNGCYLINFFASQPALNYGYNNPAEPWQMHYKDTRLTPLRNEIIDIIEFWLSKGVDGFRVDMANSLVKGCVYNSDRDEDNGGLIWLWNEIFSKVRADFPDSIFISEWVYPKNAVGKCGFDIDIIAHDNRGWSSLCRFDEGSNLLPALEEGHSYFNREGKGDINIFLGMAEDVNSVIADKGAFTAPTGSHDEIRLAKGRSRDEIKTVFAFLLTFKHFPFIYYGDEIGLDHNFFVSLDGGYIRTGARCPMQWTEGENRGFSTADAERLYLPAEGANGRSVEAEERDEGSLLNTVKGLIRLRREHKALWLDASFKLIKCDNGGYPLIYEREAEGERIAVIISPGAEKTVSLIPHKACLASSNAVISGDAVSIEGSGFALLKL